MCKVLWEIVVVGFFLLIITFKLFFFHIALVAQMVKHLPAMRETQVRSLGWEDLLEKEMATHSSTLAWRIPRMEEPDRLQSWGCKESDKTERLHFHFQAF